MTYEDIELAKGFSVRVCRRLLKDDDRATLAQFIVARFRERYFDPVINSSSKHGFTMAAIACLAIESLAGFEQGLKETPQRQGKRTFVDFFEQALRPQLREIRGNDFYKHIRCAVLHQAETTGGWRILRRGGLADYDAKTINSALLIDELLLEVQEYAEHLKQDDAQWDCFRRKLEFVIDGCRDDAE